MTTSPHPAASLPAGQQIPSLTALERQALSAWEDTSEYGGLHFAAIQKRSKIKPHLVRRVVRALARKGYVKFCRGMWTEDGEMYGSGYAITNTARAAIARATVQP